MRLFLDASTNIKLEKRSMRISGHRTSVALEPQFWRALERHARKENLSFPAYIAAVKKDLPSSASLASALRVHLLLTAEKAAAP